MMGTTGAGCVEHFGCTGRSLIQMGTLSKALGSLGGYVAGSNRLIDFLRNRAASWIYTTGLSPADTAAALAAVQIIRQEPQRREQLWQNIHWLQHTLAQELPHFFLTTNNQPPTTAYPSPILCLQVDSPATALQLGRSLLESSIFASAVRPPTVPTSRLRLTVMATHEPIHLQHLVIALRSCLQNLLP
jgi:8-amino-7-oxononanoate synthase